jgi:hypothetical protein
VTHWRYRGEEKRRLDKELRWTCYPSQVQRRRKRELQRSRLLEEAARRDRYRRTWHARRAPKRYRVHFERIIQPTYVLDSMALKGQG